MKLFITTLVAALVFASYARAQSVRPAERCLERNEKALALINQYRALRERRRRLLEGVFDPDLDGYNGKLHEVLSKLGREFGHPPYTKEKIVACLGAPDQIKNDRQMARFLDIYYREKRISGEKIKHRNGREYLIYFWRGGHDFLFYISEGGTVVDHGWWFAYE